MRSSQLLAAVLYTELLLGHKAMSVCRMQRQLRDVLHSFPNESEEEIEKVELYFSL